MSLSVNANAARLADAFAAAAAALRVGVSRGERGERVMDAGARHLGGFEAGLRIAEICLGGLGNVLLVPGTTSNRWRWNVVTRSSQPVIATLASQYAGWNLHAGAYRAMGSGPARALARKEPIYETLGYTDKADVATIVLETDTAPPPEIVDKIATDCGVAANRINVIYAPTASLAGSLQIVARVLEVALHKAHELHFPLERILDGMGTAPLSPPHPDFLTALGRTNDAIIYGGQVHLYVSGPADEARKLAEALPSRGSRDYGHPFRETFKRFNGDFYAIDPLLFSPAEAMVTAVETGESFHAGAVDSRILDASFG